MKNFMRQKKIAEFAKLQKNNGTKYAIAAVGYHRQGCYMNFTAGS